MESNKPFVIAIAAVSGGGKTTVVKKLSKLLPLTECIYFDDYDFEQCPQDFYKWVQEGADYNEWNLENLVEDIKEVIAINNLNFVLLDYPFAYKNIRVAPYINYTIFIDTPLDIAMARRILRDKLYDNPSDLKKRLPYYLSYGRKAYLEAIKTIKPNSDYIVDGSLKIDEIVYKIKNQIHEKVLEAST